jgi:hypothetical protein
MCPTTHDREQCSREFAVWWIEAERETTEGYLGGGLKSYASADEIVNTIEGSITHV